MLWSSIIAFAVLAVGFSLWANWYQSAKSVQKRFVHALENKDSAKVQAMLIHEDGSAISEQEADAFVKLIKKEGVHVVSGYADIVQKGKFLWLYKAHKVAARDQFAVLAKGDNAITYTFEGKKMKPHEDNGDEVVFGPFVPGIYHVVANYDGKYGKTSKKDTVTMDGTDQYTDIDLNIPVARVTFHVSNADKFETSKAYIQLNDEKISLDASGTSKEIGPLLLDGSQQVQTVVNMPWGKVTSKPTKVTESEFSLEADIIAPKDFQAVTETIQTFGEQYLQALAEKSTKPLKVATNDVKDAVTEGIDSLNKDTYFSGKLEQVELDKGSLTTRSDQKDMAIQLMVQLDTSEAYHELTQKADLYSNQLVATIGLSYDKDKKTWTVDSWETGDPWSFFTASETVSGNKKLYAPSKDTVANAQAKERNAEIRALMESYTQASVDAINYRDFSFMSGYLTADGPRRKEARDYIDYVDDNDIYEEWLGTELEKVEEEGTNAWKVTVKESFKIDKGGDTSDKTYRTIVIVKKVDDQYLVDELISTDVI
ncbi:hypothetical protein P5G51_003565 [Virgibacillus sp. 179-BFC.A HS]|uniref:DUF4878 domain-containing protein n=1 Tax=Tigheibacillus jepli TaxID=3035914 RepID=A0ABU5CFG2_9BACI|nr:hypothetical protein [Virgibacillus sp. 179-BFC.A HS]MDY0404607.1 hypothetical protein [Virgibacillus sp. 179-BFC.A HS]